jgi:hypothetical protein
LLDFRKNHYTIRLSFRMRHTELQSLADSWDSSRTA